jgi:hypothetical protein
MRIVAKARLRRVPIWASPIPHRNFAQFDGGIQTFEASTLSGSVLARDAILTPPALSNLSWGPVRKPLRSANRMVRGPSQELAGTTRLR